MIPIPFQGLWHPPWQYVPVLGDGIDRSDMRKRDDEVPFLCKVTAASAYRSASSGKCVCQIDSPAAHLTSSEQGEDEKG